MEFKYCPNCSKEINLSNLEKYRRFWKCDCGFELFNNIASAVGLVIKMNDGKILFERRAKEPRKNFLAFPGGFVDPDESAEEACRRECFEEIGVIPEKIEYIASFPNTYNYNGVQYKTCDIFFEAKLPENAKLKAQESEVLSFEPKFVRNKEELNEIPLAFDSAKKVLEKYLEKTGEKK